VVLIVDNEAQQMMLSNWRIVPKAIGQAAGIA